MRPSATDNSSISKPIRNFKSGAKKNTEKKKKRKHPVRNTILAMSAVGVLGGVYYSQFLDPYEQRQVMDFVTNNPDFQDADGKRMNVDDRRDIAQSVPTGYEAFSKIRYEALDDAATDIPGYDVIDITSISGQQAHYQNFLSKLPDTSPVIAALQASPDHSAEDIAKDFVENDGLSSLSSAPLSERMAVQTAVILSLKLGGYDDLADIAYTNMMNDYAATPDTARIEDENAVIFGAARQIAQDFDELNSTIWPRNDISSQSYAETAHVNREDAYTQMSSIISEGLGMAPVPVFLLNQDTIEDYTGASSSTPLSTGYADIDPTKDGEEAIFINYDDLTAERNGPAILQDPLQQRDFHSSTLDASNIVAGYVYQVYADSLSEKILSGGISETDPALAYALVSTVQSTINISDDAKSNAPDINSITADSFAARFSEGYTKWYKKSEQLENSFINGNRNSPDIF